MATGAKQVTTLTDGEVSDLNDLFAKLIDHCECQAVLVTAATVELGTDKVVKITGEVNEYGTPTYSVSLEV